MGNFQFGQSKNIIDPIFGSVQTISTAYGSIISTSFGELNLIYVEDGWKLWKKNDANIKTNLTDIITSFIYSCLTSFVEIVMGKEKSIIVLDSQVKSTE